MAVRRVPTSAGTARTPCRARNAGQQPVRRDAHICRRLPTMPSQVPRKRCLLERRRSGWAACSKRHSPPCNRSVAKCGADRGELSYERWAIRVCGTPGSARSIPRRGVCHDLGPHRVGGPLLSGGEQVGPASSLPGFFVLPLTGARCRPGRSCRFSGPNSRSAIAYRYAIRPSFAIAATSMPWTISRTVCAGRHVTTTGSPADSKGVHAAPWRLDRRPASLPISRRARYKEH